MSRGTELKRAIRGAVNLPPIPSKSDTTLILTLGARNVGWSMRGQSQALAGAAISLAGATVTLSARRIPEGLSPMGRVLDFGGSFPGCGMEGERSYLDRQYPVNQFTVTGTVTDAANGVVSFALTEANLNAEGRFFFQPKVDIGGAVQIPRLLKVNLVRGGF